jgi:hypothetical protein
MAPNLALWIRGVADPAASHGELHHMTKQERSEKRFATALEQFFAEYLTEDGVPDPMEARSIAEVHVDNAFRVAKSGRVMGAAK